MTLYFDKKGAKTVDTGLKMITWIFAAMAGLCLIGGVAVLSHGE